MKKIKVLDFHEKEKAESYFKGFSTGVNSTLNSIVQAREGGLSLSKLYKMILTNYRIYRKRLEDENNSK